MGIETACKNQGGAVPCVVTILLYTRSSAGLKAVSLIEIETLMVIYAILLVGAASSRDYGMITIAPLFSRLEAAPTKKCANLISFQISLRLTVI